MILAIKINAAQMAFSPISHISLTSCTFDSVKHGVNVDGICMEMNMQMRLCIVKLGVVSSIYGDFGEESGWRSTYAQIFP